MAGTGQRKGESKEALLSDFGKTARYGAVAEGKGLETVNGGSDFDSDDDSWVMNVGAELREQSRRSRVALLIKASLVANCVLFVVKLYAAVASGSLAIVGAVLDSFLDLLSQGVMWAVERAQQRRDRDTYPAGLSRLEPVGVIFCASVMGMSSLELIFHSVAVLVGGRSHADFTVGTVAIMATAVVIKLALYAACRSAAARSSAIEALAQDHRNDVLTNAMALATGLTSQRVAELWWLDPAGAIFMSLYICVGWALLAREQVEKLVGRAAPSELTAKIRALANRFHPRMRLDILRVYAFGTGHIAELEMVLPEDQTVRWAHDRSLKLQKRIEQMDEVERAYVHCDYAARNVDEHDWELIRAQRLRRLRREKIEGGADGV